MLASTRFFVTGTDTGVGKTYVSCLLLNVWQQRGYKTLGIKPIAAGAMVTPMGICNEDALMLMQHSSVKLPYAQCNPYVFQAATSPHLAAAQENKHIQVSEVVSACQPALAQSSEKILIEGAGGWLVPVNEQETMADLAVAFNYPIILVIGLRLGALNHALLTAQAIQMAGLELYGWIGNQIDPEFSFVEEYVHILKQLIKAPDLVAGCGYIRYREHNNEVMPSILL